MDLLVAVGNQQNSAEHEETEEGVQAVGSTPQNRWN